MLSEKGNREKKESEQHDWDAALGGHKWSAVAPDPLLRARENSADQTGESYHVQSSEASKSVLVTVTGLIYFDYFIHRFVLPERAAATVIRVATYAPGLMHLRPASSLSSNDLYQPIRRLLLYLLGGGPTSCEENLGER